jgi:hypothetical protein
MKFALWIGSIALGAFLSWFAGGNPLAWVVGTLPPMLVYGWMCAHR